MEWIKASERLPENSNPVFAMDDKGHRYTAFYTKDNLTEIEFEDEDVPDYVDYEEVKGVLTLKEGWYEMCENSGYYDYVTYQRKIIKWLDESVILEELGEKEVMIQAFDKVRQLFEKRSWIMEGRGNYPYNDDRYKEEVRNLYDEFDSLKKDVWANIKTKTFEYREKIIADYLNSNMNNAIEFAEFLCKNNMSPDGFGGWSGGKLNVNYYGSKTKQLYELFIKPNKPNSTPTPTEK